MDAMLRLAAARGISPMLELMPIHKVGHMMASFCGIEVLVIAQNVHLHSGRCMLHGSGLSGGALAVLCSASSSLIAAQVNEAIELVASGKARYRVVLVMDSDPKLSTDPPTP